MAHKKAAGAAKNLRDSQPKYRGVKIFGGQPATKGNIIVRQNGSKYECGQNTYLAADFTIHAAADGIVHFKKKNFKRFDGRTYLKTVVEVLTATTAKAKKGEKAESASKTKAAPKTTEKKPATKKAPVKKSEESAEKKAPAKKTTEKEATEATAE